MEKGVSMRERGVKRGNAGNAGNAEIAGSADNAEIAGSAARNLSAIVRMTKEEGPWELSTGLQPGVVVFSA